MDCNSCPLVQCRHLDRISLSDQLPDLRPPIFILLHCLSGSYSPLRRKRYDLSAQYPLSLLTKAVSHPYVHLAFEVLNTLFYFAGFVALATFLGKLLFCRGSVCAAARADAVFAAFSWMLWTGTTTILALEIFKGGISGMRTDKQAKTAMKEAPSTVGP
jgi:hypothetical protein